MPTLLKRYGVLLFLVALVLPSNGSATIDDKDKDDVIETIEVERTEEKSTKHPTLRYLKDNRVFLRSQLDRLHTQVTRTRDSDAQLLDERLLRLQEMAAAIAAARDTVSAERDSTTNRELLTSITELGDLESQLTLMENLLAEQRERLLWLEQDFLGNQETALVILVKGLSGKNAPSTIVLGQEDEVLRVELAPHQIAALEQGGIAQIFHEFVEPRVHEFRLSFSDDAGDDTGPIMVTVEASRDRLTFLELDVSRLDSGKDAMGLVTNIWYR
jgi:hypothetical protein